MPRSAERLASCASNWRSGSVEVDAQARVRGSDWIYTYLKSFYLDESRPLGWNNTLYPNASMPNPLWEMQGLQRPVHGAKDPATVARDLAPSVANLRVTRRLRGGLDQHTWFPLLGNPPYNVGQLNENDNNKNRKYKETDRRVAETYAKDSRATNKKVVEAGTKEAEPVVEHLRSMQRKVDDLEKSRVAQHAEILPGRDRQRAVRLRWRHVAGV